MSDHPASRTARRRSAATCLGLLIIAVLCRAVPALAVEEGGERILSFASRIRVNPDASLNVTETIRVRSTGDQIKHGIYRDFPTVYRRWLVGPRTVVGFEVQKVLRDGMPETYHYGGLENGRRVYLGREEVLLEPGEHTWTLTYRTDRQLHFDREYDELYWNVTGNGWTFPIDAAEAVVELPRGAAGRVMRLDGFTGPSGSREQAREISRDADEHPLFRATRGLAAGEGLTIVVAWPTGLVARPTTGQRWGFFFRDNRGTVLGLIGLLLLLAYYLAVWARFGRDPAPGTIVPLFKPPAGLSPAAVRFISRMGYDERIVAAALVSMAVKGYLTIREAGGTYTLERGTAGEETLAPDERSLARRLLGTRRELELNNAQHQEIAAGLADLQRSLKNAFEKVYFLTNRKAFLIGAVLSTAVMLIAGTLEAVGTGPVAAFMCLWLTGWSFGVTLLVGRVLSLWRGALRGSPLQVLPALFFTLFSIPFVGGELIGLGMLTWSTSVAVVVLLLLVVLVNLVFYRLLKAPTLGGRRIMDQIEGFRTYLAAAEGDRISRLNPEGMTPRVFETCLPYAMALDVERAWTEKFAAVLGKAAAGGEYRPAWYAGSSMAALGAAGFASSLGSSLGGAVSSSATAPGSGSGGGGGGSSGGGGGGGGGGGW